MRPKTGNGFTLIELLIVIAILGILVGVVVVALSGSGTDTARISNTIQNAGRVEIFTKQLHTLGYDGNAIAARINSNPDFATFTTAEKVIGSYGYIINSLGGKTCNSGVDSSVGGGNKEEVYEFLEHLVGASAVLEHHPGGTLLQNAEISVICSAVRSDSRRLFLIAVKVVDDIWWCSSNFIFNKSHTPSEKKYHSGFWNGFYRTAPSGKINKACHNAKTPSKDSTLFDGRPIRDHQSNY